MNHFITKIQIEKLRHLDNISILIDQDKRRHLLLTGKNGSGKTSLLIAIKKYLSRISEPSVPTIQHPQIRFIIEGITVEFNSFDNLNWYFNNGSFVLAYFSADRKTGISRVKNAENVELEDSYPLDSRPSDTLLKYLIHLKTQQAYARNENDMRVVNMLDEWFERFVKALRVLFDSDTIELKYDYKNYNFLLIEENREPYGLDQLSDGYSAALSIFADLLLRMEQNWLKKGGLSSYDTEGIVLIDELETHLHIGLQKTILPFLTTFFSNIQFIVTTHSPYILNSISDCVVYDLEKNIRMEDMSNYSAEGIVEGYFEFDTYSNNLISKIKRYKELVDLDYPTEDEKAERGLLRSELKQLSGDLSKDAREAFWDIEDKSKKS